MALATECSCGAHLEFDERFAGQTIQCPDCGQTVHVPTLERVVVRTSGLALAAFILVLVGAFTVVGTALAVILGLLALRSIGKHRQRLAGRGYALTAIFLGVPLTGLSLFAYTRAELFGLDRLLREPQWAGKLNYLTTQEVREYGFAVPIVSKTWARYDDPDDTATDGDGGPSDFVVLVNVRDDAHAIAFSFSKGPEMEDKVEAYRDAALERFTKSKLVQLLERKRGRVVSAPRLISTTKLPGNPGREPQKITFEMRVGKYERTFVMRVIPAQDSLFVIAAGARKNRFEGIAQELQQIVDAFKVN